MEIHLLSYLHNCFDYCHQVFRDVDRKTKAVWDRVVRAYTEPQNVMKKLELSPVPPKSLKKYKNDSWPWWLNAAWGKWGGMDKPLWGAGPFEDYAKTAEPKEKVTSLHAATLGTNYIGMRRLIANGAYVNARDIRGQTPAYWAAHEGNLMALMLLKIYGADLNQADIRGKTPLRAAAKNGHDDVVTYLASQGVELSPVDERGVTPLHLAAFLGRDSIYESLYCFGAKGDKTDKLGRKPYEVRQLKYAEIYHNRWFLFRLFSSPKPPSLELAPDTSYNLKEIATKLKGN
jgi:hypothetical protein